MVVRAIDAPSQQGYQHARFEAGGRVQQGGNVSGAPGSKQVRRLCAVPGGRLRLWLQ